MRIAIVVGTRPEIVKMSPVIKACQQSEADFAIIDTKQHYSDNMSGSFFRELELPQPDYALDIVSGTHGQQLSSLVSQLEGVFNKDRFDVVLVQGDTNTVLAGGLMATRAQYKVGHVEAGLRSGDRSMPEEVNRIMIDHISDYLFTPSEVAYQTLRKEGIEKAKIWNTGNTVVDATLTYSELAQHLTRPDLKALPREYILLTLHRPANVDNPETLKTILSSIETVMKTYALEVVFPVHPRTRKNIAAAGIKLPAGFHLIPPQDYLGFLHMQSNATLIMTDSGGVQEEACILHVPCVTLRENTERPETITIGANMLGGTQKQSILAAVQQMIQCPRTWSIPYGDGNAGVRILDVVLGRKASRPAKQTLAATN